LFTAAPDLPACIDLRAGRASIRQHAGHSPGGRSMKGSDRTKAVHCAAFCLKAVPAA